ADGCSVMGYVDGGVQAWVLHGGTTRRRRRRRIGVAGATVKAARRRSGYGADTAGHVALRRSTGSAPLSFRQRFHSVLLARHVQTAEDLGRLGVLGFSVEPYVQLLLDIMGGTDQHELDALVVEQPRIGAGEPALPEPFLLPPR